jgi:hypothetical protein
MADLAMLLVVCVAVPVAGGLHGENTHEDNQGRSESKFGGSPDHTRLVETPANQPKYDAILSTIASSKIMYHSHSLTLYLQDVAFPGHHLVQHRVDEKSQKEPREKSSDDHDRERFLRVRADPRGQRGGKQSKASD